MRKFIKSWFPSSFLFLFYSITLLITRYIRRKIIKVAKISEILDEKFKKKRLTFAIKKYIKALSTFTNNFFLKKFIVASIVLSYDVIFFTLKRRVVDLIHSHFETQKNWKRLNFAKENVLKKWIIQIKKWGWFSKIFQIKYMIIELLKAKKKYEPLEKNWMNDFLNRHSDLQSRFNQSLIKKRVATHNITKLIR